MSVRDYYASFDEWARLESPAGRLEFARACELIDRHVPPASRVLDLGGGPGRYALALAERGHQVVLADLSPELLDDARRRLATAGVEVESIDEVDAVDLIRYADGSFDAVLAFGPFYHLVDSDDRRRAALELRRVIAPGGVLLCAFIPRASGLAGLLERAAANPAQVPAETLREAGRTGVFRNPTSTGFQEGHYPTAEELEALFAELGLQPVETVSLRGIAYRVEAALEALEGPVRDAALQLLRDTAGDRGVVATSGHAVAVFSRP